MSKGKEEPDPDFGGKAEASKTSMQILSELFSSFDAEPPVIVKKEKTDSAKKHKKSKKKRKHKEKKHKKKSKKKKRSSSSSSSSSSKDGKEVLDLAQLLIKQEKDNAEEKIKIEGTSLSLGIKLEINKNREEQKVKSEPEESKSKPVKQEPKKHKHKEKSKKRHSSSPERQKSKEKRAKYEPFDLRQKLKEKSSPERKHTDSFRSQRRDTSPSRDRYSHHKSRYREREASPQYKDDGFYRSRSRDRWISSRERYRSRDRSLEHHQRHTKEDKSRFDKKKLLEIARKNAMQMMKSGSLPGALTLGSRAQEKMIAAIKSGGKTVEELTDFCKSLSKKEELGELSSLSENEDSDTEEAFHHPFKLKDRPTGITMNIKNAVPLPTKTTLERTSELRIQFPVSSGQQHRVNEEWVPVATPKAIEAAKPPKPATITTAAPPLPIEAPPEPKLIPAPPNAPPGPQIFPDKLSAVDISSIVTQRLTAMRKLQENPNDVQALTEMYRSNKEMDVWAKSKQQFGQFTGSTGVQVLTQAELASGYQAWAKKDQLQTAAPVSGGMGMHLLQKMGWKPGEGLGKEKTGSLEPLLLEVKLDKKGLVANEEQTRGKKKPKGVQTVKTLQGKHPVSLLGEYASKRKLGAPQYILEFECGPDHKKNFLFKVMLNGIEYKPNVASANKKEAKAFAATMALKQLGLLV